MEQQAGLNYISSQEISGALIDIRGWEVSVTASHYQSSLTYREQNFDIFAGDNEEPIIAIHVPSTPREALHSLVDDAGMEVLDGLCRKVRSFSLDVPCHIMLLLSLNR